MTDEQLKAVKDYIKAVIAHKIEDAFGRDALIEWIAETDAERVLDATLLDQALVDNEPTKNHPVTKAPLKIATGTVRGSY